MRVRIAYLYVLTLFLLVFASCDKSDPIASYLYVPKLVLQTDPSQGTTRHDFKEVYVYDNGSLLGAFPVPGLIPVIASGKRTFTFFASVYKSGIKDNGELYPMVDRFVADVDVQPTQIDTIVPIFKYIAGVKAILNEDFEAGGTVFATTYTGRPLAFSTTVVYEGAKSGEIFVDTLQPLTEIASVPLNSFPLDGRRIFVEMDYKSETDILVGLEATTPSGAVKNYLVGLKPNADWKKLYLDLSQTVAQFQDASSFKVLIQVGLPFVDGKFGQAKASVYLDNLKLLY